MNDHILDYLDYYTTSLRNPMFAVMIDGAWGAGKTTLIRRYLKDRKLEHSYISLYGATTGGEIAERIFVARHPILGSRGFAVAGRVLRGLLKASFKIDIDGKIVDGIDSTPVIPDAKDLQEYAQGRQSSAKQLIVFDDLERCPARAEMWSVINRLVEHEEVRVILLSAEDKMASDASYRETKEKNIGITFRVEPDVEAVIDTLIEENELTGLSEQFRAKIIDMFRRSGCKSLRVLRFSMRDFARLLEVVPERHRHRHEVVQTLLTPLFAFAFGVYGGEVRPAAITELFDAMLRRTSNRDSIQTDNSEAESSLHAFAERHHDDLSMLAMTPSLEWWRACFEHGVFDGRVLEEALDARFPLVDTRPNWLKLANFSDLTDLEFLDLLGLTREELQKKEYRHPGEILHVVAVHLWAAKQGLIDDDASSLVSAAKAAISALEPDDLRKDYDWSRPDRIYRSYGGVIYAAAEDVDFLELAKHLAAVIAADSSADLKLEASNLNKRVSGHGEAFLDALGFGDPSKSFPSLVLHNSFLQFVDQQRFVEDLYNLDSRGQDSVISGISMRINQRHDKQEKEWVTGVIKLIEGRPPTLRRYFMLLQLRRCLM